MKRLVTVLSLLMLLFALLGGQAFTADINDPSIISENHPWEDDEGGNGQGNCNQTDGIADFFATAYFPLDILVNDNLFLIELKKLLWNSDKSNTTYSGSKERDLYIDRTRQASFK